MSDEQNNKRICNTGHWYAGEMKLVPEYEDYKRLENEIKIRDIMLLDTISNKEHKQILSDLKKELKDIFKLEPNTRYSMIEQIFKKYGVD